METSCPERLVQQVGKACPTLWREADFLRRLRDEKKCDWAREVFLPSDGWIDAISRALGRQFGMFPEDLNMVSLCMFAGAWRPRQDIITIDDDTYSGLSQSPPDSLPCEILKKLPSWCVYIRTPGLKIDRLDSVEGFMAALDVDEHKNMYLTFLFMQYVDNQWAVSERFIHLTGEATIAEAMRETAEGKRCFVNGIEVPQPPADDAVRTAVALTAYVCAYGMDDSIKPATGKPPYPQPKKTKKGWRLFPPPRPNFHTIGTTFGDAIREWKNEAVKNRTGTVSPHIRRAHFHHYWMGKEGERRLVARWLPPIPVAMRNDTKASDPLKL